MAGQQFSVINNLNSLYAQQNLYQTNIGLNKSIARLSSGMRIIDASDDAAGLFAAASFKLDGMALAQATRNASDAASVIAIADGALNKLTDLLARGITLASNSATGFVGDVQRKTLDVEFQQILTEVNRVVDSANFRGELLFSTSEAFTRCVFVGDTNVSSWIKVSIGGSRGAGTIALGLQASNSANLAVSIGSATIRTTGVTGDNIEGTRHAFNQNTSHIKDQQAALMTMTLLQNAVSSISRWRGAIGAQQNRLINSIDIIQVQSLNLKSAESLITDANMAEEIVKLTKWQILMQSGMSSLAQANATSQQVLALFR